MYVNNKGSGASFHEALDFLQKLCDSLWVILEVLGCIKDKYSFTREGFKPFFVFVMNKFKVVKRDFCFFRTHTTLGALMALLWRAFEVNNLCAIYLSHVFEGTIEWLENFVFSLVHVSQIFHQFAEHVLVCQNGTFRDLNFIWVALWGFVEFLDTSEDRIDLEGKSPTFGLHIVLFKHVDILSTQVLPLCYRFLDPSSFSQSLP